MEEELASLFLSDDKSNFLLAKEMLKSGVFDYDKLTGIIVTHGVLFKCNNIEEFNNLPIEIYQSRKKQTIKYSRTIFSCDFKTFPISVKGGYNSGEMVSLKFDVIIQDRFQYQRGKTGCKVTTTFKFYDKSNKLINIFIKNCGIYNDKTIYEQFIDNDNITLTNNPKYVECIEEFFIFFFMWMEYYIPKNLNSNFPSTIK